MTDAIEWLNRRPLLSAVVLGLIGAITGAAAVRPERVFAVVSRGGRPDLASNALASPRRAHAPMMIVGGADTEVLVLNPRALSQLMDQS